MEATIWVKFSLMAVILVIQMLESIACLEEERKGLLELNAFFKSYGNESFDPLPSWVGGGHTNCCKWERVKCSATGRVIDLSLGELLRNFTFSDHFLNVSLFQPFEELKSLNLTYNWFTGLAINRGLKRLEILDVRSNRFNNSIMSTLSELTSLKTLILQFNDLDGRVPTQDLAKLTNLEFLDLSKNGYFDGSIPLQDLRSLSVLDLSNNTFNGSIPIEGLCEMNNLVELDMSMNSITDHLPHCLGNLPNLRFLDISSNQFHGKIPSTIVNLTSLEYLSLADNYFEGLFMFDSLANLSKLKVFQLSTRNSSKLHVETENSQWSPTFHLKVLTLRNCNLNKQSTSKIPSFLFSQHDLRFIDLAHNKLVGTFPLWLLQNNSKLEDLNLTNNSFSGILQLPDGKHNLLRFQISSNKFSGELPMDIGLLLPRVEFINISGNGFEGNVPSSMNRMQGLCSVDLSNNKLSGEVPTFLFSNMSFLECLLLENNYFGGRIKNEPMNTTILGVLDISNNRISGEIPSWIGRMLKLRVLQMSKNILRGELPTDLCYLQSLIFLDVSENQLSGQIPSCFHLSSLKYLYMQVNDLSGVIHHALSRNSKLIALDLSYNKLSGEIPIWLNEVKSLQVLLLNGNQFQGPIPQQLCQLRDMSIMDLSNNKLIGSVPSCLNNMSFGKIESNILRSSIGPVGLHALFKFIYFPGIFYNATLEFSLFTEIYLISEGQVEVDFTTKSRSETYKGDILNYMSGLDLSSNELTGHIPLQIGDLHQIRALNFSHNNLNGWIPETISNLRNLESLDISYNALSGNIPWQLTELHSMAIFNVSYNNLSGRIPTAEQFATFPPSSFLGNPHLCGQFLDENHCSSLTLPPSSQFDGGEEGQAAIDLKVFCWTFVASYVMMLLALVIILWVNPHWRRRWFHFITICCSYLRECVSYSH